MLITYRLNWWMKQWSPPILLGIGLGMLLSIPVELLLGVEGMTELWIFRSVFETGFVLGFYLGIRHRRAILDVVDRRMSRAPWWLGRIFSMVGTLFLAVLVSAITGLVGAGVGFALALFDAGRTLTGAIIGAGLGLLFTFMTEFERFRVVRRLTHFLWLAVSGAILGGAGAALYGVYFGDVGLRAAQGAVVMGLALGLPELFLEEDSILNEAVMTGLIGGLFMSLIGGGTSGVLAVTFGWELEPATQWGAFLVGGSMFCFVVTTDILTALKMAMQSDRLNRERTWENDAL